jgi:signal transduction histidine kinase/FixJ family two-component response regulator
MPLSTEKRTESRSLRWRYLRACLRAFMWVAALYVPFLLAFGLWRSAIVAAITGVIDWKAYRDFDAPFFQKHAGDIGVANVYVCVTAAALDVGGELTAINPWWPVIPALAVLMGRFPRAWIGLTLVTYLSLVASYNLGLLPTQLSPVEAQVVGTAGCVGAFVVNAMVAVLFYADVDDSRRRADGMMRSLRVEVAARTEAELEARDALDVRQRFLAMMSHEIRTPLHGVLGTNQLLSETTLDAEQRRLLGVALEAGKDLCDIVDEILDHAKLEAGRMRLDPQPFAPRALVEQCLTLFAQRARESHVLLDCTVSPSTPMWMSGDDHRVRQILRNLVSNAVKFTEHGAVHVGVSGQDGAFRLVVTDTGIGIAPEALETLFEPFVQADDGTTRRFGGTGLGLSITRDLIELMGGTVSVTSVVDQGTTFVVELPLRATTAPPDAAAEAKAVTRGLDVLVVEDNLVNQMLAKRLLEREGHSVVVAEHGAEAVERVARARFDVVLMDMQMPVMDGLEATRRIRALGCEVPIVALSASVQEEDRRACLEAGMDAFLSKPLDFEQARQTLARFSKRSDGARTPPVANSASNRERPGRLFAKA